MAEIQVSELRIGNLVQGKPIQIPRLGIWGDGATAVTAYGISLIDDGVLDFKPIPLTEQWLLDFGFVLIKNDYPSPSDWYFIKNEITLSNFTWIIHGHTKALMKYVHQLQNLYFALTGEELELNRDSKISQFDC